jgi:tetratricopeptide (TPR) repeat protein
MATLSLLLGLAPWSSVARIGIVYHRGRARHLPSVAVAAEQYANDALPRADEADGRQTGRSSNVQLKKNPKDKDLLLRVAYFYKSAHQFKEAVSSFDQSLEIDPGNVAVRTEKASCLYYTGEIDGALSELQESLKLNPKDANTLFNLGVIRWKGKKDPAPSPPGSNCSKRIRITRRKRLSNG